MEDIKPQGIPEQVLKDPRAFNLYRDGVWFVGGILSGIVLGVIVLSFFGVEIPDMLGTIGALLAGALVTLIAGERISKNE